MNSNGKITAPVSLHADVYPVLGLTKTVTYDTGWVCGNSHGRINKWAKYKPTKYGSPDGDSNWWKATDGNCGFSGMHQYPYAEIVDAYENNSAWKYNPPTPGADWCRLADFNGYDHNALPFLRSGLIEGETEYVFKLANPKANFTFITQSTSGSLSLSDFASSTLGATFSNGRLAAIIFEGNGVPTNPANSLWEVQYGDSISVYNPSIELDFTDYVGTAATVVFAIGFTTTMPMFMPLPQYDSGNAWYRSFQIRNDAAFNAQISIQKIGFLGDYGANSPLAVYTTYSSSSNPFVVSERGQMTVEVLVTANQGGTYTIYNSTQFKVGISMSDGTVRYLPLLKITSINGSLYDGKSQYSVKAGSQATVKLTSYSSDPVIPPNLTDGQHYLYLYDDRFSTMQSPIHTISIYVDMRTY